MRWWRLRALVILISAVALMWSCSPPSSSSSSSGSSSGGSPDYAGTWTSNPDPWGGGGTLTETISATTTQWSVAGGSYGAATADFTQVVDESAKHMTLTVTGVTGALVPLFGSVTTFYETYTVSGTTLETASATALPFPANATTGSMLIVLTK